MFTQTFLMLTLSAFLGGGGLHGVVVKKTFKPLPLADSLGMSGIYRLELRDKNQKTSRQMVSQETYAAYEVGDEFDDRATADEVKRRRIARQEAEAKAAVAARATKVEVKPELAAEPVKRHLENSPVAQNFRKHDMLPETEGF